MSRVYTRTGDDGTTGQLFGGRVSKGGELVEALGDLDEAVSAIGVARSGCEPGPLHEILLRVQRELFVIAADLAANPAHRDRLQRGISLADPAMTDDLELIIDEQVERHPLRPIFVVPGTTPLEAALDLARAIVRRAERHVVQARDAGNPVNHDAQRYLNRLSDLLFVLGRQASEGAIEPPSHV